MHTTQRIPRKIGLWAVISLVTGNIIGSGAFLLPSRLAGFGLYSLVGWGISAFGAILLALSFGALSRRIVQTGGPHAYVQAAMGDTAGFFTAWSYWILSWISNTALVIGAVSYLSHIFGGFSKPVALGSELILLLAVGALNLLGIRLTGRVELITTILKLLPLIAIPVIGLFFIDPSFYGQVRFLKDGLGDSQTILKTVTLIVFWAFLGLETGTVPSGEINNPRRTIPMGTLVGTLIAAGVYFLGLVVMLGVIPQGALISSSAPYAELTSALFGGSWHVPVAIAAILCCLSSLNGWTLVTARIPLGAAQEGLFPHFFGKLNRFGAPQWGVIISTLCSAPLLFISMEESLMSQFDFILDVSVTMQLMIYCAAMLSFLILWNREKKRDRGLIEIIVGLGAFCFAVWVFSGAEPKHMAFAVICALSGLPFYSPVRRMFSKNPS